MATRKDNLKALFSNTRTRVIIVFTGILLLIAVTVGIIKLRFANTGGPETRATLTVTPGIQSIPGVLNPTAQYAKLQEAQNVTQAKTALETGGSAIPTIIKTQSIGGGVQPLEATPGEAGVGFTTLVREGEGGPQRSLWLQALQNSNCSKDTVTRVVNEGATLTDLKTVCNCAQLRDNGYQLSDLEQICSCKELRAAGFTARQLKEAAFSAGRLRQCGFDACELRNAGFTAQEMKDGGFSDGELKGAGFTDAQIAQARGLPSGITESDVRKVGCEIDSLKRLRSTGVAASAIRRISGCSITQLKAASFTAQELKNAGFSAADLKNAGFTAAELRQAGYTARDLFNAGFTPAELAEVGFTPGEIAAAESELPPGISPADVKSAGSDPEALRKERLAGVSAKLIRQYAGSSPQALKEAGFTNNDLLNAGFTPEQINAVGYIDDKTIRAADHDPQKLRALKESGVPASRIRALNGSSAAELKAAGFDAKQLLVAGLTPQQLLAAGFTPEEVSAATETSDEAIRAAGCDPAKLSYLASQGASAKRIRELNGCSGQALKSAGFDARALSNAGFTPQELLALGFTPQQIMQSGVSTAAAIAAGRTANCNPEALKAALASGVSATSIKQTLGCSAATMKAAGYNAEELRKAGFTAAELRNAGFTLADLKKAGFTAKELYDAGFSALELKNAGFSAAELRNAGFNAMALKNAGFSAKELRAAGFSAAELKNSGFSARDLQAVGFNATELKNAGFTARDLQAAGFSASDLKDAGFSAKDLQAAGFSAAELKRAGFTASELREAGFSATDLRKAGFSVVELHQAGYPAGDLLAAGISQAELRAAGYTEAEISNAAITPGSQVAGLANINQQGQSSTLAAIPLMPGATPANVIARGVPVNLAAANNQQLQEIINRQNQQLADQRFQQRIQQRIAQMMGPASQFLQNWERVSVQSYTAGIEIEKEQSIVETTSARVAIPEQGTGPRPPDNEPFAERPALIKTGDVLFAVMDTSVNSDEPGPILATIVSGKLKGAKLIGSFNMPRNAEKMVISFNTMSVPGASKSTTISAYAIDPNTARTALSSNTDHHYLLRYGSLFAASFLQGFGNAFQSANTTVTIGGTGGGNNITVQNGIRRSLLQNAVIGLATLGKNWSQIAMQQFNTPTTVEVYSGTPLGILFTQDVTSL